MLMRSIEQVMSKTGVQFGTSGVRGLVTAITDEVCWLYTTAFLQYLTANNLFKAGDDVAVAGDLRQSTPRLAAVVIEAIMDAGGVPIYCGLIPSPAVAYFGLRRQMATIMVTGSHIPEDRNGLKFNKPDGELLKPDELGIRQQFVGIPPGKFDDAGTLIRNPNLPPVSKEAFEAYVERYVNAFPSNCLHGKQIGLYEHSAVSRESLKVILERLGATVIGLGYSEQFLSVDTEAIRPEDVKLAKIWAQEQSLDCIISTDGDGDRPLISDEFGNWFRGDIVGILTAQYFQADVVVTPISSNSAVEKCHHFEQVIRTKIGSPYVIAEMQATAAPGKIVVGYEANGGFLHATPLNAPQGSLYPLPTRDATIVPLALLMLSQQLQRPFSALVAGLPSRYTASNRLKNIPADLSQAILAKLSTGSEAENRKAVKALFPFLPAVIAFNQQDGVRITLANDDIIHLRPSGNAPELRVYSESATAEKAEHLNQTCLNHLRKVIDAERVS